MDIEKMQVISRRHVDGEEDVPLPGFRFHPTDEELVGFYLRRKVDKKPLHIDLIKQIDIYKYDPWDLPQASEMGEKEWYFFCRRGRKYRNSIRPNRVTGSGFWKATGIDQPIYSSAGSVCIGLKKSLVYYRGSAGKGTKTEWMMHEFRLPPLSHDTSNMIDTKTINGMDDKAISQEAEVWTLCRILKRNMCHKKTLPDLRKLISAKRNVVNSKTCSRDFNHEMENYIRFQTPVIQLNHVKNPFYDNNHLANDTNRHLTAMSPFISTAISDQAPSASSSCFSDQDMNDDITKHGDWDDLRSVVEFASADRPVFFM